MTMVMKTRNNVIINHFGRKSKVENSGCYGKLEEKILMHAAVLFSTLNIIFLFNDQVNSDGQYN